MRREYAVLKWAARSLGASDKHASSLPTASAVAIWPVMTAGGDTTALPEVPPMMVVVS